MTELCYEVGGKVFKTLPAAREAAMPRRLPIKNLYLPIDETPKRDADYYAKVKSHMGLKF